jgi:GT2 family glycosyltransferase
MNNITCLIVSCSKSDYHRSITNSAISSSGVDCIVIETCIDSQPYKNVKETLIWSKDFNYNACLNFGLEYGDIETEYIALCNNDIEFQKGWVKIIDYMKNNDIISASPFSMYNPLRHGYKPCYNHFFGYQAGAEMCGWCIIIHKSVIEIIGRLDESYKFWCSDDAYADQLKKYGIQHALCCGFIVNHIGGGSKTLKTLSRNKYMEFTLEQYNKYNKSKLTADQYNAKTKAMHGINT